MVQKINFKNLRNIKRFQRDFLDLEADFFYIGSGSLGGKALGLAYIDNYLKDNSNILRSVETKTKVNINIPKTIVITTELFDIFMKQNDLYNIALSNNSDELIAYEFQKASMPIELLGDLRSIVEAIKTPLAIRSSSLIEDSAEMPMAGIYETKMLPNNQSSVEKRFQKLIEAIKFVYASTYFSNAKKYLNSVQYSTEKEKMAIIIQECVGRKYGNHYYPNISGVARSYNYYPFGNSSKDEGVVNLALGLGRIIVDDGISWRYSPARPKTPPPFNSIKELMQNTQKNFWAITLTKEVTYNPISEVEFLENLNFMEADYYHNLDCIASTYNAGSDMLIPGCANPGPRVIDFAPVLKFNDFGINDAVKEVMMLCEAIYESKIELEFAIKLPKNKEASTILTLLQVRALNISEEKITIDTSVIMNKKKVLLFSNNALGNCINKKIQHLLYVKRDSFNNLSTRVVAEEIRVLNQICSQKNIHYILIGYGRWGSTDPFLGIPVKWGDISHAKAIVEVMLPGMHIELSQGSHFFHNLTNLKIPYLQITNKEYEPPDVIDWKIIENLEKIDGKGKVLLLKAVDPFTIMVDGEFARGIIFHE